MGMSEVFNKVKPYLLMVALQFGSAGTYILSMQALTQGMSRYVFIVYRNAIAALVLALFALVLERKIRPKMTFLVFFQIVGLGFLEPMLEQNFAFLGVTYTSATFVSAIMNAIPSVTFVMAVLLRLERVKMREVRGQAKITGRVVTFAGPLIMTLFKGPVIDLIWSNKTSQTGSTSASTSDDKHWVTGTLVTLLGCMGWSAFYILQVSPTKKVEHKHRLPPADMQINGKASYSTSGCSWEYDVFISFRGDTRMNFTDHLYKSLVGKGIRTFRDDNRLGKGKGIQEHVFYGIENSRFSIIVFSKDYAASEWCLDELAKIMECPLTTPLPVFYGVEASEVLDQTGSFQASFQGHESNDNTIHKIIKWRNAMKNAANTVGWEVGNRHETEIIGDIIKFLSVKLNVSIASNNDSMKLVGMSCHVKEVIKYLNSEDLCYLGISGMSGIGKTALASLVYEKIRNQFDATTFLPNIRDASERDGIVSLQARLLSKLLKEEQVYIDTEQQGMDLIQRRLGRIKVLIVLDDVSKLEQLEALAGRPHWFVTGSKVIITTNNKHVLNAHQVIKTHVVDPLNDEDALELFYRVTFGSPNPPQRFAEHSKKFVHYAKGHPLALKVLGSSLIGRNDIRLWDSRLCMVTMTPDEQISTKLLVSFNELNKTEKEVFLHIACFFNGWERDRVEHILCCNCEFDPIYSMEILRERNLMDISNGRFHVHDLYQQIAQNIVHNECLSEPNQRSRLWSLECVSHVFRDDTNTPDKGEYLQACRREDSAKTLGIVILLTFQFVDIPVGPHEARVFKTKIDVDLKKDKMMF